MNKVIYPLLAIAFITCIACQNKSTETDKALQVTSINTESSVSTIEASPEMTDVILTDKQVKSLKITVDSLPKHIFEGQIEANGTLEVMPQSEALVSPYIGANVKSIMVKEGQMVKKGQALAYLASPELLDLQSRYLTTYNKMTFVTQEYNRQKQLYTEKIGAGKDYQQIKSEYQTLQAELRTIASQLRLIGISPTALQQGKTYSSVAVISPISGTVEEISVKTGQHADVSTPMFRIVNTEHLFADLLVFEKDVPKVKVGQKVLFSLKASIGCSHTGKVYSVGKTFESNPKAVHVRVSIDGTHDGLVTGMYLCGKIASDTQQLPAIPEDGIIEEAERNYIFTAQQTKSGWTFHPLEVKKGRTEDGYVEITLLEQLKGTSRFALDNAYYLISEMKKAETGEDD